MKTKMRRRKRIENGKEGIEVRLAYERKETEEKEGGTNEK